MSSLNLGCYKSYLEHYINLDINKNQKADVYHDLNKFPYPFKEDTFIEILCSHTLEHLDNPLKVLEELWRISKNHGQIIIKVPHWSSYLAYSDLTHKHYFSAFVFAYYELDSPWYYSDKARFKILSKKYKSFESSIKSHKIFTWFCKRVEWLANKNCLVTEQILCKFLPINEIDYVLEVIK